MRGFSAVFVCYRSGAFAPRAIASLREAAREAGAMCEVVCVVNSGDEAEAAALGPLADRVVVPPKNLGFAGGLNAGLEVAGGDPVLLSNPDVVFLPGSVAGLLEAAGTTEPVAAGPSLWADEAATLLYPWGEEPHPFELARRRAARTARGHEAVFARSLRRSVRSLGQARAGEVVAVRSLRGVAVLATRRSLSVAGPFDEGYPLYYEENDWQLRLLRLGGRLAWASPARVVHRHGRSARQEPRAAGWFAASEKRYFGSHFGAKGLAALAALEAPAAPADDSRANGAPAAEPCRKAEADWVPPTSEARGREVPLPAGSGWVVLSPSPTMLPFLLAGVGAEAGGAGVSWRVPGDFAEGLDGESWTARTIDAASLAVTGSWSVRL